MPLKRPPLSDEQIATLKAWIDQGAQAPADETPSPASADALGLRPAARPAEPPVADAGVGAQPDRPLHPGPAGEGRDPALARGRPRDADPPGQPRPDRPAARRPRRSRPSWPTPGPTPTSGWSIGCSPRRTTASAGAGTGSTWPATPTPTATASTPRARSGSTATGSSTRSTATCRSTSSPSSSSPATCCPNATLEQKIATGFHRNTLINQEGGIDLEQFRVESVVDRVDTTGDRLARPDDRLRPVPRPQVRPDHPARVLPVLRLLQQRRRARPRPGDARGAGASGTRSAPRSRRSTRSWRREHPSCSAKERAWEADARQLELQDVSSRPRSARPSTCPSRSGPRSRSGR